MGLFRQSARRSSTAGRKSGGAAKAADKPDQPRKARQPGGFLRFLKFVGWLALGIAVMAGVGYLVAAIWLFPAPLLPSERVMPRVMGLSQNEANRQLERLGFRVEVAREPHVSAGPGLVTWQDPPPGVAATTDTRVRITVSSGLPNVRVPDVRNMDLPMAERLLGAVGLRIEAVDTTTIKTRWSGTVAGTTPAAGDSLPLGRGVTVHLAN